MLVRIFRATALPGMEDAYARYLDDVAGPTILCCTGAREVEVYEPLASGDDFLVKGVWDDLAAVISFAGTAWWRPTLSAAEQEMLATVEVSHYRSSGGFRATVLTSPSGRVVLDPMTGSARIDGDVYRLPPIECRLLAELAREAGRFVAPAELARRVWGGSVAVTANDVRRSIYRLRRLIRDQNRPEPVVRSKRGYGYMLEG